VGKSTRLQGVSWIVTRGMFKSGTFKADVPDLPPPPTCLSCVRLLALHSLHLRGKWNPRSMHRALLCCGRSGECPSLQHALRSVKFEYSTSPKSQELKFSYQIIKFPKINIPSTFAAWFAASYTILRHVRCAVLELSVFCGLRAVYYCWCFWHRGCQKEPMFGMLTSVSFFKCAKLINLINVLVTLNFVHFVT